MSATRERELVEALRKSELEGEAQARQRTLETVRAAYAEREPRRRRHHWVAASIAAASIAVAGVIGLTPAGAEFREWVQDTVDPQSTHPKPVLTALPGGGSLLAQSQDGASVVPDDGPRRFLGDFSAASWSPHGLNVGVADGHTIAAVNPLGELQWSWSAAAGVRYPAWSQDLGYRVAYLSGDELRVIAGDGSGDRAIGGASPVAPVWRGQTDRVLAYADARGAIRVIDVDRVQTLEKLGAPERLRGLAWSGDGERLLAFSPRNLQVSDADGGTLTGWRAPPDTELTAAGFLGDGERVVLLQTKTANDGTTSSTVSVFTPGPGATSPQVVFRTPGLLKGLALSPDGKWLVVGWRSADQWLFLEPKAGGEVRAFENISAQVAAGDPKPPFPRPTGWCCGP